MPKSSFHLREETWNSLTDLVVLILRMALHDQHRQKGDFSYRNASSSYPTLRPIRLWEILNCQQAFAFGICSLLHNEQSSWHGLQECNTAADVKKACKGRYSSATSSLLRAPRSFWGIESDPDAPVRVPL